MDKLHKETIDNALKLVPVLAKPVSARNSPDLFLMMTAAMFLLTSIFASFDSSAEWPEYEAFAAGTAYIFPQDGKQDIEKGVALIRQAADAGNPEAQYALAILYRQGTLIRKDEAKARTLLENAAQKGLPEAKTVLGKEILDSLGDYDSTDEGRLLLMDAAEKGNLLAHTYLGKSYLTQNLRSYENAVKYLTPAAEGGIVDAQLHLGITYYVGGAPYRSPRVLSDYKRGYHWIDRAAEGGSAHAFTWIGWIYQEGKAVKKDLVKAVAAWKTAAEMRDGPGANQLALAYRDGIGVARNRQKYTYWTQRAAEFGHRGAKQAIERDQALAEKWEGQALATLILLGLVAGASDQPSPQTGFMDPRDPMQAWGTDIIMRIK